MCRHEPRFNSIIINFHRIKPCVPSASPTSIKGGTHCKYWKGVMDGIHLEQSEPIQPAEKQALGRRSICGDLELLGQVRLSSRRPVQGKSAVAAELRQENGLHLITANLKNVIPTANSAEGWRTEGASRQRRALSPP